jgi:hypothetical protein
MCEEAPEQPEKTSAIKQQVSSGKLRTIIAVIDLYGRFLE